jgi:hypothetical protein
LFKSLPQHRRGRGRCRAGLPREQRSLESWPICATARGDRFRPWS